MKLLRKVTASTDNVANQISELQDVSNELVDSILQLIDNLPVIQQSVIDYDKENAKYGDSLLAEDFTDDLKWTIKQLKDVVQDVQALSTKYTF